MEAGPSLEFRGSELIHARREDVFDFIVDARHFASGIPDIQSVRVLGPDKFSMTAKLGISVIKSTFDIDFEAAEKTAPKHVELHGHGISRGSAVDLEIVIDLEDENHDTVLMWMTVVRVSGTLATLGQRVLNGVADKFVKEVFGKIRADLETRKPTPET
jgi:carbon monoxide dehydrogenase subunit G